MVNRQPARCNIGRRVQLSFLLCLDVIVIAGLWYSTTVPFVQVKKKIALTNWSATLELNANFKIAGLSVGVVNRWRTILDGLYTWTWRIGIAAALFYYISQLVEYFRRKALKYADDFKVSIFGNFFRLFYFAFWLVALIGSFVSFVLDCCAYAQKPVYDGIYVIAQRGIQAQGAVFVILIIIGIWRSVLWGARDLSAAKKQDANSNAYAMSESSYPGYPPPVYLPQ